jgi:hypothetical protein
MMTRRKTVWGTPGQTGVTKDGIPWYVPEEGPGFLERLQYKLFPAGEGGSYPPGARLVPARTADEVRQRFMRRYGDRVARVLNDDEEIVGFVGFALGDHVPQPPGAIGRKTGPSPVRQWWMGGGWDSLAGQLITAVGGSKDSAVDLPADRHLVWVRTDKRVAIMDGPTDNPTYVKAYFGLGQVGVRPGDYLGDPAKGQGDRVDIAFADGSWIGLRGYDLNVPGSTEKHAERMLLAELAGPPVVSQVQPAVGLGKDLPASQAFAWRAEFRPDQDFADSVRAIASTAPVWESRRSSRPEAPDSSRALTTPPSGRATRVPAVT